MGIAAEMASARIIEKLLGENAELKKELTFTELQLAGVAAAPDPGRGPGSELWLAVDGFLQEVERTSGGLRIEAGDASFVSLRAKLKAAEPFFDTIPF